MRHKIFPFLSYPFVGLLPHLGSCIKSARDPSNNKFKIRVQVCSFSSDNLQESDTLFGNRHIEKFKKPENKGFSRGPKRQGKRLPIQKTTFLIFLSALFHET